MEAPGLVIEDVMKLERRAMEKKVAYIEHFLTMSEDEKKLRNDLRDGKRKKKKGDEPEAITFEGEEAEAVQQPLPLEAAALPPPRSPSIMPPRQPSAGASSSSIPQAEPEAIPEEEDEAVPPA